MSEVDRHLAERLSGAIASFEIAHGSLPGLIPPGRLNTFIRQIVESNRRNRYISHLLSADLNSDRADPQSDLFDPLKAAVLHSREGDTDEAFWLVFLFVHFGRHPRGRWRYAANVYGGAGPDQSWTWAHLSHDVHGFRNWIDANADRIRLAEPPSGFGNHRKYESLGRTGEVVSTYVQWVGDSGHHLNRIEEVVAARTSDVDRFEALYRSLSTVLRFGRTARFDYLTMIGRLGLIDIHPERAFISGSTGPRRGAHLLFDPRTADPSTPAILDTKVTELQAYLQVGFDVVEDALCNWQKSPEVFKPFRG